MGYHPIRSVPGMMAFDFSSPPKAQGVQILQRHTIPEDFFAANGDTSYILRCFQKAGSGALSIFADDWGNTYECINTSWDMPPQHAAVWDP